MARNATKSDFRSSKMAAGSHFVNKIKVSYWSENGEKCDRKWFSAIQNGRRQPFCEQIYKKKTYLSEMARNAIESDFRYSKMAAGSHFVNKMKKIKVAYWFEMVRNVIEGDFRSSKMAAGSHFVKKINNKKSCVLIWHGEKCDRKWFLVIQNGRRQPFCEKEMKTIKSCILIWKWREMRSKFILGHPKWGGGHHNGQPVNHSVIYTVFALGQIHQFLFASGFNWMDVYQSSHVQQMYGWLLCGPPKT